MLIEDKIQSKKEIGARIRALRIEKGMSQEELANKIGYTSVSSRSTINKIEMGKNDISQSNLLKYARALDTTIEYLLGLSEKPISNNNIFHFDNIIPIETKKFPLLGEIACGKPIVANEEFELYIEAGASIKADFCLRARGDSMIGARIYDGDIVFIRKQEVVENGEIAAVIIDDEATLKRIHFDRESQELLLFAENPNYKTMRFIGEELDHIHILGKAVAFQSDIK